MIIICVCAVLCLVAQSCLTLCDPMDCTLPGSSVHGESPVKNTGVDCHALLQRIFPIRDWTQVSCIAGRFFASSYQGSPHLCLPYIKYYKRKSDEVYQYMVTVFNCWQWVCQCSGEYEGFSHDTLRLPVILQYLEQWMRKNFF